YCSGRVRQEQRLNGRQTWIRQHLLDAEVGVGGRNDVVRGVAATGGIAECCVDDESASASDILNLISAAQCCLTLTKPWNVPCKAHRGPPMIHIPLVDSLVRVRRVRPYIDDLHQVAAHSRRHPIVEAVAGYSE